MTEPDTVLTVWNYWDGPRSGAARYRGAPRWFECIFDPSKDDWSDYFLLEPLDPLTLSLVMERHRIWSRWAEAFHSGRVKLDSWPTLPEDRTRWNELKALIEPRIEIDPLNAIVVRGDFTPIGSPRPVGLREYEVRWTEIDRGLVGRAKKTGSDYRFA